MIATQFRISFEGLIWFLRGVILLGPPVAYSVARQVCYTLQDADRERLLHGAESGRIVRLPSGEYIEPHEPLSPRQQWVLDQAGQNLPLNLRLDDRQKVWEMMMRAAQLGSPDGDTQVPVLRQPRTQPPAMRRRRSGIGRRRSWPAGAVKLR